MSMTGTDYFSLETEYPDDGPAIEAVLDAAFGSERQNKTSYRLRDGQKPLPGLGLTLRRDGGLIGTIRFWPVMVGAQTSALLLGPLAVHPTHHGHGGGQLLMQAGLDAARRRGYELVFLVGDQPYYCKAGFLAVPAGRVTMPGVFEADRLLYQELTAGAFELVRGMMRIPCGDEFAPGAEPIGSRGAR